jgi:hypothetical protein
LGLLGGVGGAAVGGYVANVGQEQRFEHERATQLRDLRIDTYVRFLRAAEREHNEAPQTEDRIVRSAEAEVALLAPTEAVRQAAGMLAENTLVGDPDDYTPLRNRFIEVAQADLED